MAVDTEMEYSWNGYSC